MPLLTRVARLFRADFHAVLDRVEEPDILLRQAIREMEEILARDEQACQRRERERDQLVKKAAELQRAHAALTDELDVCFAANNEGLARALIRRKLETERSLKLLERRRDTVSSWIEQLSLRLQENRDRYEGMRQKAELFDERQRQPEDAEIWNAIDVRVRDEDVEVALLKERQRREGQ